MTKHMLVCGGRGYEKRERLFEILDKLLEEHGELELISGAAPGADSLAIQWAKARNVPYKAFPAKWKEHGRAAGPIRNQQMLDEGKPTFVIAFPGHRGTQDMIVRAQHAGIPVQEIDPLENLA